VADYPRKSCWLLSPQDQGFGGVEIHRSLERLRTLCRHFDRTTIIPHFAVFWGNFKRYLSLLRPNLFIFLVYSLFRVAPCAVAGS